MLGTREAVNFCGKLVRAVVWGWGWGSRSWWCCPKGSPSGRDYGTDQQLAPYLGTNSIWPANLRSLLSAKPIAYMKPTGRGHHMS